MKKLASAGMSQLRETEIGVLARLVRWCNIGAGAALILGACIATLWECVDDVILCDVGDCDSGICDLDGDGLEHRCVQMAIEPGGHCEDEHKALVLADTAETRDGWVRCWLGSERLVTCMYACQLNWTDVFSTMVISIYMLPLGGMLLAFEFTRANTLGTSAVRGALESSFGFIFLYNGRMFLLLFSGLLACGNIWQEIEGEPLVYHWWCLLAGLAAVGTAFLHLAVKCAHPEYDADMTRQLEQAVVARKALLAKEAEPAGGVRQVFSGAAAALGDGIDRVRGTAHHQRARTPPRARAESREDVAARAVAAVAAARALTPTRSQPTAPPAGLPAPRAAGKRAPPSLAGLGSSPAAHVSKRQPPSLDGAVVRAVTPPRETASARR
jgi:hypothetical protein